MKAMGDVMHQHAAINQCGEFYMLEQIYLPGQNAWWTNNRDNHAMHAILVEGAPMKWIWNRKEQRSLDRSCIIIIIIISSMY